MQHHVTLRIRRALVATLLRNYLTSCLSASSSRYALTLEMRHTNLVSGQQLETGVCYVTCATWQRLRRCVGSGTISPKICCKFFRRLVKVKYKFSHLPYACFITCKGIKARIVVVRFETPNAGRSKDKVDSKLIIPLFTDMAAYE